MKDKDISFYFLIVTILNISISVASVRMLFSLNFLAETFWDPDCNLHVLARQNKKINDCASDITIPYRSNR